jgi:hypothetical protein
MRAPALGLALVVLAASCDDYCTEGFCGGQVLDLSPGDLSLDIVGREVIVTGCVIGSLDAPPRLVSSCGNLQEHRPIFLNTLGLGNELEPSWVEYSLIELGVMHHNQICAFRGRLAQMFVGEEDEFIWDIVHPALVACGSRLEESRERAQRDAAALRDLLKPHVDATDP